MQGHTANQAAELDFESRTHWPQSLCGSSSPAPALVSKYLDTAVILAGFWQSLFCLNRNSIQFSHSVVSNSLRPHGLQYSRPPCPSPTPGVYSNSCPLSRWHHPTISSSLIPFSSHLQSYPASGSFPMSQLFISGGQSIEISASTSVLPMNSQDWSPLEWTGWISLQSKGLSRVFSSTTVQKRRFFGAQLSLWFNTPIFTWRLEKPKPRLDGPLLAK